MQDNRYNVIDETLARVPNAAEAQALPAVNRRQAEKLLALLEAKFFEPIGKRMPGWCREVGVRYMSPVPTHPGNHDKGLGRLVHDVSHALFARVYPRKRLHDPLHVRYETDVAEFVATSKRVAMILNPKPPRPEPPPPSKNEARQLKLARIERNLERWAAKERRAVNAIKKLKRQQRGLLRALENVQP